MPRRVVLKVIGVSLMVLAVVSFGVLATLRVFSGAGGDTYENVRGVPWTYWGAFVVFVGMVIVALVGAVNYLRRTLSGRGLNNDVSRQ